MSEWFWKKLNIYVGFLSFTALLGLITFSANVEIKDLDLWLHLAVGKYILANGVIPSTDILTFTRAGQEWINHEWLFQVLVASVHNAWGILGLNALKTLLVLIPFLVLFRAGYRTHRQLLLLVLFFLIYSVFQIRFTLRPDLLSIIFFTAYGYLLTYRLKVRTTIPVLIILQILWVNTHGFFILGPLWAFLVLAAEVVKRKVPLPFEWNRQQSDPEDYVKMWMVLIVVSLACLVNPNFLQGALYPFHILTGAGQEHAIFFENIVELARPITSANIFQWTLFPEYKLLILLSFLSFLIDIKRINLTRFLFWLAMLLFSLSAIRNVPYFAFAAFFVIIGNLENISSHSWIQIDPERRKFHELNLILIKIVMVLLCFNIYGQLAQRIYYHTGSLAVKSAYGGQSMRNYPSDAATFIKTAGITGNLFNDFNSGAYLEGRLFPAIRTYIDGRTELFGPDFYQEYKSIISGNTKLFEQHAESYGIDAVFLSHTFGLFADEFLKYLDRHPLWKPVYFAHDGIIFLKDTEHARPIIMAHAINLNHWQPPRWDLSAVGRLPVPEDAFILRARTLIGMKYLEQAKLELQEALRINPASAEAYKMLSKILLLDERYAEAYIQARKAKVLNVKDTESRYYLAKSLYHLGEVNEAIKQTDLILRSDRSNAKALYLMSLLLSETGREQEAKKAFERAYALSPKAADDIEWVKRSLLKENNEAFWIQLSEIMR